MEQKIIVLREHTQRTRHRSRKDVRARRKICGVLAALCFLLLLGVVGGMENGTMALGHRHGARDGNRRGWCAAHLGGGRIPVCSKAIDAGTPGGGREESASCSCW